MKKRIVALALSVLLLLSLCPLSAFAADEAQVVAESVTTTQGGYVDVYLRADRFMDVSVLDIEVFYDSAAMRLESANNGTFFSGASVSTNTTTIGMIKISAMSVKGFHSTGYYYDDRMMTLRFRVLADCPAGDYPIRVAVGDAYDSNLAPTAITGVSGVVTVKQAQMKNFTLNTYRSTSSAQQGDTVTIQVNNNNSHSFAGADFRVEYDRDLLKLTSTELSSGLKVEGAVYSINGNNPGYAAISYVSTNAVTAYSLFTLTFEVLADTDAQAEIQISANDVYDDDLIPYASYSTATYFQITKKVEVPDYPDFTVSTVNFELGQTNSATVTLQGGAEVAAGDFIIHYDKNAFAIVSVTADPATTAAGALIFINPNFDGGEIKFSYVNQQGSFRDDMALVHVVLTAVSAPSEHFVLSATGMDVYNIDYEQTQLEYVSDSACIYAPTVTPPTCTEQGYTTYTCAACADDYVVDYVAATGHSHVATVTPPTCTEQGYTTHVCHCGDTYVDSYVAALGHDEIPHEEQIVTCLGIGWAKYVTCSRCDYTTYVEIPALGHDEIVHAGQEVTCLELGWNDYVTCSRCDYTTYAEIPALGHDEVHHGAREVTCTAIGWNDYVTCSRCDYTTYVEIPALGHDEIAHAGREVTCLEIGWDAYVTCSRCDYTTYAEIPALGHRFVQTVCEHCGLKQTPIETWDVSAAGDGRLMASIYYNYVDGGYELEIVGSGDMADYDYDTIPWNDYRYSITRVMLSEGITSISDYAFYFCTELQHITIPDSVEHIGTQALAYAYRAVICLEGDSLPAVLEYDWAYASSYFLNPQKVLWDEDAVYVIDRDGNACLAKYLGDDTEFIARQEIDGIPLTRIGQFAFYQKNRLKMYQIPDSVEIIDAYAFGDCVGLVLLLNRETLPDGFAENWNGYSEYYLGATLWEEDGFLFVKDASDRVDLIGYYGDEQDITVPAYPGGYPLERIRDYAFYQSNVIRVVLPEGITEIGRYAFAQCYQLQDVLLPDGLRSIGEYAFYYCNSLRDAALPQSLTSLDYYAFWGCGSLTAMVIPEGITALDGTFVDCYALESVELPDGITRLGSMTFYGCHSLKELRLPKSLQSIEYMAFYDCYELRVLDIPEGVRSMDWSSLEGTTLDTLYIRSPQLAATLTPGVWDSEWFQIPMTVVVPDGSATDYLQSIYPYYETMEMDGVNYAIYSSCTHGWEQIVISEYVPCQNDGVYLYTCTACGVEKVEVTPCHDMRFCRAQAPTCTAVGWQDYEYCTRCDYSTYVEIPMVGHTYDGDYDPDCNVCGDIREIVFVPGDVNDDGKVNNRDLGLFQRYLNDWDITINPLACDMNEDGRINNRDLALLQMTINL